jgi:hypothetical protein
VTYCFGHPREGTTNNRSRIKFIRLSIRHPQLCPPKPEADQWLDEISLWQTGQLCGLPRGWRVALSACWYERKVTQASIPIGGPILGSHVDKWCGVQHPAEPYIEAFGGTLGLARTSSGKRLGREPLKRVLREQLESNNREPSHGDERRGQAQMSQAQPLEKKKWRYTCRLFGSNSIKEEPMWHVGTLLNIGSVNNGRC